MVEKSVEKILGERIYMEKLAFYLCRRKECGGIRKGKEEVHLDVAWFRNQHSGKMAN